MNPVRHVLRRRAELFRRFDVRRQFEQIEESCVPSYLHHNAAAAAIAWWRLFVAVRFFRRFGAAGPALDFGAATGELGHLLGPEVFYEFVEIDEVLARTVTETIPRAIRLRLEDLPARRYGTIFALDSLEHNENVPELVDRLVAALAPSGVLIVSGPSESALYRLGRRLAGFHGHYHHTNIDDIECVIAARMHRVGSTTVPIGIRLFSISAWKYPK